MSVLFTYEVGFILHHCVTEHDLGEVFSAPIKAVLSMTEVIQPDIHFISKERQSSIAKMTGGPASRSPTPNLPKRR